MKKLILLAIVVFLIFGCGTKEREGISGAVRIESGLVRGVATDSVIAFKGIPFAAPPVGNLRWKAPQPPAAWDGVRVCDAFGPSPMQAAPKPFMVYTKEFLIPEEPISEDCLYLNVWTAAKNSNERRPVLVWIYGGGFSSGGSAVPIYDGAALARKGVVFVSVNYRVGIFGFFAMPGLSREASPKTSGNYGLMDQIAALRWVAKNISAFGGDPGNVTIAGQSAGSMSVSCLVASPEAKGLFHKAIAESGSTLVSNGFAGAMGLREAEEQGRRVAQSLYASTKEDMRGIPADTLVKVRQRFGPIVDGYIIPESMSRTFDQGRYNRVPLLTGWNADEGFVWNSQSIDEYIDEARTRYGADMATFLTYYPAGNADELAASRNKLSRDMTFALSNYRWAVIQDRNNVPAYVYYFIRKPPATPEYQQYKSFHTAEVAYALDNLEFVERPWEQVDFKLEEHMSQYWVNFARTGDPNGAGLPAWPRYDSASNQVLILGDSITSGSYEQRESLEFLYRMTEKTSLQ